MRKILCALAVLAGSAGVAEAAVVVRHHNAATLEAALSDIRFEDFEDAQLIDGLTISGNGGFPAGQLYRLVRNNAPSIIAFAEPSFGFGGLIRSAGFGQLAITLFFEDGTQQLLEAFDISPTAAYLGFSSDVGIDRIDIRSGTAGAVQFYLDDLTFGDAAVAAAVPEPAHWAMLIVGFGMIGATMRRRGLPQARIA